MKKLVLYGAGGMGREVACIVEGINERHPTYDLLGFIDDGSNYRQDVGGYTIVGNKEWLLNHKDEVVCTCTIGYARSKADLQLTLENAGVAFESIIAPNVFVPESSSIGPGSVIYPGTNLSVNCHLGRGVLLNSNITVGHDTVIGDFTSVMTGTGISGGCRIGAGVDIGGHVFLIPGRKVGDGSRIAAGSVVFNHVKSGTTVLGNPAKRMKAIE